MTVRLADACSLPPSTSKSMKDVHAGHAPKSSMRKPLEKSKLSVAVKSKNPNKPLRLPGDDSEFYSNIWASDTPITTTKSKTKSKRGSKVHAIRFVDISQVAHVLTTIDYKDGYECRDLVEQANINVWAVNPDESNNNNNSMNVHMSYSARSNLSNVTEHDTNSEDDSNFGLQKGFSTEDMADAARIPISGPVHNGDKAVFSNILANNVEVDMSWNSRFLLGLHEPVRHALFVIDRFLDHSHDKSTPMEWNVSEFFSWFKQYFVEFFKNQHEVKMKVIIPLIKIKYTVKREILASYESIYDLLDGIVVQEDQLLFSVASAVSIWHNRLLALQSDIRRLNLLILNVLSLEEEELKPVIGETFTEQSFLRYVMPRVFRSSRPKRVVIPWIVERCRVWGGEKVAQAYKDELPFTARFMYDRVWHPYFVTHVASAMKNLDRGQKGTDPVEASEPWFACTIQ